MSINQTERTDNFIVALEAAIAASKIPFQIFDASFFKGEGELEGDWTVVAESPESEYAIVIETITIKKPMPTLAGMHVFDRTAYKIYYPYYDKGDDSVGLEDAWVIDFDDNKPDYTTEGVVDVCLHTVSWFIKNEIMTRIENAICTKEYQSNHSINPHEE